MSFWKELTKIADYPQKVINKNVHGTLGKYIKRSDVGHKLLDTYASGTKEEKQNLKRRWGGAGSGAIGGATTGFLTGGPYGALAGAIGGGVYGYQGKKPLTGRRSLQKATAGAGIGLLAGGAISGFGGGSGSSGGSGATAATGSSSPAWLKIASNVPISLPGETDNQQYYSPQNDPNILAMQRKRAINKAFRELKNKEKINESEKLLDFDYWRQYGIWKFFKKCWRR